MPHLSNFGSLGKKGKVSGEDANHSNHQNKSISSWRIKRAQSQSSSSKGTQHRNTFASKADSPLEPRVDNSDAPQLPPISPLTVSSFSSHDDKSRLPGSTHLDGHWAKYADDDKATLLPPQPAFLGRRSSSSPNATISREYFLKDHNNSSLSLISVSSGLGMEAMPTPRKSTGNQADRNAPTDYGKTTEKNNSKLYGVRMGMRAIGRRLFQRDRQESLSNNLIEEKQHQRPTLTHAPPLLRSSLSDTRTATPPLSSQSDTPSMSSSISAGSYSPETPGTRTFPSIPPNLKTIVSIKSFPTIRNTTSLAPFSPSATSPTFSLNVDNQETELSSDFLDAVLGYATSDNLETKSKSRKILTQPEADRLMEGQRQHLTEARRTASVMASSLWTATQGDSSDDDNNDDYGEEGDKVIHSEQTSRKPVKMRQQRGSVKRSIGLDTAAKRAIYSCTIIKFYPKLTSDMDGQSDAVMKEIRLPRSVNLAKTLQQHPSSYSHKRSIRIGLARSRIIRRLNTESISLSMEQELQWFIMKYLPHFISPNQLPFHLARKAAKSNLEALARPPLAQGSESGMALWASRPPFAERCECVVMSKRTGPIDLYFAAEALQQHRIELLRMPLQLSKRCQALANISSRSSSPKQESTQYDKPLPPPPSPSDEINDIPLSPKKGLHRLAPPWAASPARGSIDSPTGMSRSPSPLRQEIPTSASAIEELQVFVGDKLDTKGEEDEDVPLAKLLHRRSRAVSEQRALQVVSPIDEYARRMIQERDKQLWLRRQRESKLMEDQRRLLGQARERRATTEHAAILSSPTYGAGDTLLSSHRQSRTGSENGLCPSSISKSRHSQSPSSSSPLFESFSSKSRPSPRKTGSYSSPSRSELPTTPSSSRVVGQDRRRKSSQTASTIPSAWSPVKASSTSSYPSHWRLSAPLSHHPDSIISQQTMSPYGMMLSSSPQHIVMIPYPYYSTQQYSNTPPPIHPLPNQASHSARLKKV